MRHEGNSAVTHWRTLLAQELVNSCRPSRLSLASMFVLVYFVFVIQGLAFLGRGKGSDLFFCWFLSVFHGFVLYGKAFQKYSRVITLLTILLQKIEKSQPPMSKTTSYE